MKKYLKKSIICCICFVAIFLMIGVSNASTLNMNYNNKAEIKNGDFRVYPGDEIYIVFSLDNENNSAEKPMAIYGKLEYDDEVLELVKTEENGRVENPKVGDGWLAGSVNEKDNTFFFYTLDDKRSSTVGFVKFRVKSSVEKTLKTAVTAKDVSLYKKVNNSNYEEITSGDKNIQVDIRINNKNSDVIMFCLIVAGMVVGILVVTAVVRKVKNSGEIEEKCENVAVENSNTEKVEAKKEEQTKNETGDAEKKQEPKQENKKEDIEAKLEKLTAGKIKLEEAKAKLDGSIAKNSEENNPVKEEKEVDKAKEDSENTTDNKVSEEKSEVKEEKQAKEKSKKGSGSKTKSGKKEQEKANSEVEKDNDTEESTEKSTKKLTNKEKNKSEDKEGKESKGKSKKK